jgi:hypothetical protein
MQVPIIEGKGKFKFERIGAPQVWLRVAFSFVFKNLI